MNSETIKFQFTFKSTYWNKPPAIIIKLDNEELFNGTVDQETSLIEFTKALRFGRHRIDIIRHSKDNSQTKILPDGTIQDQLITLEKLTIDGIDIRDIVYHYSYARPVYPEPWASLQKKQGNNLPEYIRGQTCWGHNLTWTLKFKSPFYLYVMNWMRGDLNESIN